MLPKIYPYSQTWNELAALDDSAWTQFLVKEMPILLEDAYTLAQEMVTGHSLDNPDHLKKMTMLLQEKVIERITQKMQARGISL